MRAPVCCPTMSPQAELGASHTRLADSVDALQQEMAIMRAAWVDQERDVAEVCGASSHLQCRCRR